MNQRFVCNLWKNESKDLVWFLKYVISSLPTPKKKKNWDSLHTRAYIIKDQIEIKNLGNNDFFLSKSYKYGIIGELFLSFLFDYYLW